MAVTPPEGVMPAVGGRPAGAVGTGLGDGGGGQRGGPGVGRTVEGSGGLGLGAGLGVGVGLGDGGSTMGAASGTYVERDGDGWLGDGAFATGREALHPPAASRMATPAVATRFVNEALPR